MRYKKAKLTKTQRLIKSFREERKKTSAKRKKTIIPGPWTDKPTKLKVRPKLKENQSICSSIGAFYGIYRDTFNWNEKGWYPISINITFDNIQQIVQRKGIDEVMIACERELSACLDEEKKKRYGTVILLSVFSDNSQKDDPKKRFLSCWAKTNKKRVIGFLTTRKGELVVLKPELEELDEELESDT